MTEPVLRLSLDVHPVGPRVPVDATHGWLAVNVAAAYDDLDDATQPGDERLIPALLPPSLFNQAAGDATDFVCVLYSDTAALRFSLTVPAPMPTSFSTQVIARLQKDAERMAARGELVLGWGGDHMDSEGDTDAPGHVRPGTIPPPKPHPWFGIASLLAALPAGLATPLRCRWYLELALVPIRDAMAADPTMRHVVVAPRVIHDANRQVSFVLKSEQPADDGHGRVTLTFESATHPDVHAHVIALDAASLFAGTPTDPGDYWLALEDSRHDSAAEIDQMLRGNGDPTTLAAIVSADQLQKGIRASSPDLKVSGAVVSAFRQAAGLIAGRLSEEERRREAGQFASAILERPGILGVRSVVAPTTEAIAAWWRTHWNDLEREIVDRRVPYADQPEIKAGDFGLDHVALAAELSELVEGMLRLNGEAGPVLPGEGIDFVVGRRDERLVSYNAAHNQHRTIENEIAHIGLLVRRSSSDDFTGTPWRIVTAGQPVLDEDGLLRKQPWGTLDTRNLPHDDSLALSGITLAYKDGVLRNDDTYRGQLMVGPSALSFLHQDQGTGNSNPPEWTRPAEVVYASGAVHRVPGWETACAPALRYDDRYQLAAFIKDRAGGLPREIATTRPWMPDFPAIAAPAPAATTIHFQRRVPVGALNLKPSGKGWPAPPKDVFLLATECWHARTKAHATPPVLLFSRPQPGQPGQPPEFPGTLTSYEFVVEPPRIDEHTLQRWALPKIGAADAAPALNVLKEELVRIAEARESLQDQPAPAATVDPLLPHDPAVTALLIRTQLFGPDGKPRGLVQEHFHRFQTPDPTVPFHKAPLTVRVGAGAGAPGVYTLAPPPPGHFAQVELSMLCLEPDQMRFDTAALRYDTLPRFAGPDGSYRVHPGETILLETATAEMPAAHALYDAFVIAPDARGSVAVAFNGKVTGLEFVDRFELRRQRWVWRNLPYVTSGTATDLERRLNSGLPIALSDLFQENRDSADAVIQFDMITGIDRGFVERPRHRDRWPRTKEGIPASQTQLLLDSRDGQAAADYLRYELTVVSRYAGVLTAAQQRVTAHPRPKGASLHDTRGPWRRVAVRNSATDELRALNILAVLPLTASPRQVPDSHLTEISKDATPHLVILDEVWFREYGPGECLRAQLALEEVEIGDANERPVRFGPLPHKHLEPSGDTRLLTDAQAEDDESLRLPVFGPFGFSLDRSGNEALANASAFVVYLPPGVGPQWSMAVRFRRVLQGLASDGNIEERKGAWSSPHLLYSLPDSRNLIRPMSEESKLELTVEANNTPTGALRFEATQVQLAPYRRHGQAPDPRILQQYRYLLIVGRPAKDGGHGIDAFIPQHGLWIDDPTRARTIGPIMIPPGTVLLGYVLEVELDGSFGVGASPLEAAATSLVELFRALLQTRSEGGGSFGRDAMGRITRMSEAFPVKVTVRS
jgi:hypothetical protein